LLIAEFYLVDSLIAEFYLVDRGLRHRLPGFSSLNRRLSLPRVSAGSDTISDLVKREDQTKVNKVVIKKASSRTTGYDDLGDAVDKNTYANYTLKEEMVIEPRISSVWQNHSCPTTILEERASSLRDPKYPPVEQRLWEV
jgi:hypothetical protein